MIDQGGRIRPFPASGMHENGQDFLRFCLNRASDCRTIMHGMMHSKKRSPDRFFASIPDENVLN